MGSDWGLTEQRGMVTARQRCSVVLLGTGRLLCSEVGTCQPPVQEPPASGQGEAFPSLLPPFSYYYVQDEGVRGEGKTRDAV